MQSVISPVSVIKVFCVWFTVCVQTLLFDIRVGPQGECAGKEPLISTLRGKILMSLAPRTGWKWENWGTLGARDRNKRRNKGM